MTILIIEDEESIREVLQELLEFNGHSVLAAPDGVDGLALAARRPDIIICDIHMPRMDGYQVLMELKNSPTLRDIPFVFLTAAAGQSARRRGMELGAADYLSKPFTEKEILNVLATHGGRR